MGRNYCLTIVLHFSMPTTPRFWVLFMSGNQRVLLLAGKRNLASLITFPTNLLTQKRMLVHEHYARNPVVNSTDFLLARFLFKVQMGKILASLREWLQRTKTLFRSGLQVLQEDNHFLGRPFSSCKRSQRGEMPLG
ncbi:uncharacterized protein [Malus domestica]|uniref:uncharacterized protein n=1 Tax=Malus domestica TaxID=3750 RepID=UPI0010AA9372|nr:uncharacterized protein LOC103445765 [Malus domestica]